MADENTPLIAVVQTRPHRDRYTHHTLRYICTLALSAILFFGIAAVVLVFAFVPLDDSKEAAHSQSAYLPWAALDVPKAWPRSAGIEYKDLQNILITTPDAKKAREWSKYYTSGPHLAGKNLSQAIWTKEKWQEFGVENTLIVDYDIYVNYPKGHRLALLEKNSTSKGEDEDANAETSSAWKIKYEASLEEDVLEEDGTSGLKDRIPTFHGYSASGNVTAPYVYVNYGTYKDFEELLAANVSLSGKIALIKYGGVFRGLKVKRAQELGMVGAVIYTDPGDDGEVTEYNGNKTYPEGPAREPSSVQRGSTQFLSKSSPFLQSSSDADCQVSLPVILQRPATLRNPAPLASPSTTLSPRFHRSPSPT
jgi:N-acetylated-alpha-linked acidic dipeptidase